MEATISIPSPTPPAASLSSSTMPPATNSSGRAATPVEPSNPQEEYTLGVQSSNPGRQGGQKITLLAPLSHAGRHRFLKLLIYHAGAGRLLRRGWLGSTARRRPAQTWANRAPPLGR